MQDVRELLYEALILMTAYDEKRLRKSWLLLEEAICKLDPQPRRTHIGEMSRPIGDSHGR